MIKEIVFHGEEVTDSDIPRRPLKEEKMRGDVNQK